MKTYKDWQVFETMPDGFVIDKTAGSPLSGYEFITNGKSVINGQIRALCRVKKQCDLAINTKQKTEEKHNISKAPKKNDNNQIVDKNCSLTLNNLARKQFEEKMLKEILFDLKVCEIEGWNKLEYINELKNLICGICKE